MVGHVCEDIVKLDFRKINFSIGLNTRTRFKDTVFWKQIIVNFNTIRKQAKMVFSYNLIEQSVQFINFISFGLWKR